MGKHLMRALNHDGLEVGSHRTKYTQVALKKGTSLGPSLFTWKQNQHRCHHFIIAIHRLIPFHQVWKMSWNYRAGNRLQAAKKIQSFRPLITKRNLRWKLRELLLPYESALGFALEEAFLFHVVSGWHHRVRHARALQLKRNSVVMKKSFRTVTLAACIHLFSPQNCLFSFLDLAVLRNVLFQLRSRLYFSLPKQIIPTQW